MKSSGRIFSFFVTGGLLLVALFLLGLCIYVFSLGRLETVQMLVALIHKPEKLDLIAQVYLTEPRFKLLQTALFALGGILFVAAWISWWLRSKISPLGTRIGSVSKYLNRSFWQQFTTLTNAQLGLLGIFFAALISVQVYLLRGFPAHTDEAFSYTFFVHKGWLTVISYYPLPNNHVFYNLLCTPLEAAGLPPLLVMRLPTLVISWLIALLLFGLVRKLADFKTAFLALVIFSSSIQSFYFAVHGRGYMLLTLLALLAGFAAFQFTRNYRKIYLIIFILASAFGFYAVPVFAYAFVSFGTFACGRLIYLRKFSAFRQFVSAGFLAVLLTVILYAPILLTSGLSTFMGSDIQQVAGQNFRALIAGYLQNMPDSFWGFGFISWIIPLAILGVLGAKRFKRNAGSSELSLFLSWVVLSAVLWVLLSQVMPPLRTWLYWSLFAAWGAAVLTSWGMHLLPISKNWKLAILLIFSLGWLALQVRGLKSKIASGEIQIFYPLPAIIGEIMDSPAKRVFAGHEYYDLFLQFDALRYHRKLQVDLYEFHPEIPYDYLLVPLKKSFPDKVDSTLYRQVFRDHVLRAYRLKSLPEK